jgi:hypothetical protein
VVGGLLEVGAGGELMDVDAALGQHAGVSVDPADRRFCCDDAFQTLAWLCCGHVENPSPSRGIVPIYRL